jgi:hypothetical protein
MDKQDERYDDAYHVCAVVDLYVEADDREAAKERAAEIMRSHEITPKYFVSSGQAYPGWTRSARTHGA